MFEEGTCVPEIKQRIAKDNEADEHNRSRLTHQQKQKYNY